ncbi:uncharacterized protein HKW66_Vig0181230 [Vigna angularis]|uniref:Uncharacterized protein n=1 Tax=Phaseolus angularis TaxID=3914 RepID=A0A8T0K5K9_PHAAN|nr:uncharacterized protein HKW66_Vig0181230 [Vigna angularis]
MRRMKGRCLEVAMRWRTTSVSEVGLKMEPKIPECHRQGSLEEVGRWSISSERWIHRKIHSGGHHEQPEQRRDCHRKPPPSLPNPTTEPPAMFLDPASQIAQCQTPTLMDKRNRTFSVLVNDDLRKSLELGILLWKSLELGKAAAKGWLMLPSYWNSDLGMPQNGVRLSGPLLVLVQVAESEKKVMDHRLLELEKQLLDNNDEGEVDAVSMVYVSKWR